MKRAIFGLVAVIVLALNQVAGGASTCGPSLLDRLSAFETRCDVVCPPPGATAALRERIDALTDELTLPADRTDATSTVRALNAFVFEHLQIEAVHDLKNPDNLFLSRVLERRRGYCVGIAALYLVLAERLDLPIFAVATPSHLFLRHDDGTTRINIETFQRGANLPDDKYMRDGKIPVESVRKGVFLRNMTDDEFLAQIHNNLGVIFSEREQYAMAEREYRRALDLHSDFPAALYNLGNDLLKQGKYRRATRHFSRSLRLYPSDPWALNNRGLAYQSRGKVEKARRDFEAALEIDPAFEQAKRNLEGLESSSGVP